MYDDLSKKQLQIFNFIKSEIYAKGYPPSVREICKNVGLKSTSTVHGHLSNLEKKGYIRRDATKPRAIEVLEKEEHNVYVNNDVTHVPIVGKVTAGQPILAVENIEDTFPLPMNFIKSKSDFMLSVQGESMIGAGILDGDYVLVHQQNIANNGDIVVALIEDEATIKRFYKEHDHIRLQPENDMMAPILVKSNIKILGKVSGVFRKM